MPVLREEGFYRGAELLIGRDHKRLNPVLGQACDLPGDRVVKPEFFLLAELEYSSYRVIDRKDARD